MGGSLPDNKKDFDDLDSNTKQAVIQEIVQQKVLEDDMKNSKIKDSKITDESSKLFLDMMPTDATGLPPFNVI